MRNVTLCKQGQRRVEFGWSALYKVPELNSEAKQSGSADRAVRAMTQNGAFRVIAVRLDTTCAEVMGRQGPVDPQALRHLLCGAVLIRETMQPGNRVQIVMKDAKASRVVADSFPDGRTRGLANVGPKRSTPPDTKGDGLLQVNYTLRNGVLHQGMVNIDDCLEDGHLNVSKTLMRYLQESEQITSFMAIRTVASTSGKVPAVGGFVVQVTPETEHDDLAAMTARLEAQSFLSEWLKTNEPPQMLIASLLPDHEYAILSDAPLRFGCTCSTERMLVGLSTLGSQEIGELLTDGDSIEVCCDACGTCYDITSEQLATLLVKPKRPGDDDLPPN